jgi:hypothetical protein
MTQLSLTRRANNAETTEIRCVRIAQVSKLSIQSALSGQEVCRVYGVEMSMARKVVVGRPGV